MKEGENMQLIRFDPFKNLLDDDFVVNSPLPKGLKIHETDKNIVVEAVVAGVPKKNVDIEIEDGVLTIKAEVKEEKESKDQYKSSFYQYYYTTALSGGQWNKAEADIVDGIVKIQIPKAESARPKKITIKAS